MMNETDRWQAACEHALADENTLDYARFGYDDAWALGSRIVEFTAAQGHPIAVAIVFGEQRVFHAALAGSAATNDDWLARKFRTVARRNCSSWATACRVRANGGDFFAEGGYAPADFALAGGAAPLRVRGSLIGAVGVSGLAEEDDHRVVIDAMQAHLITRGGSGAR